jgi:glutamine cyclotransferase
VAETDRDPSLFTQGLFFAGEDVYDSAGLYGQSKVRRYRLNGEILAEKSFSSRFFAEGLALAAGSVYVLTWLEGTVFLLDPLTLEQKDAKFLPKESWGLTFDGTKLWRSDGSAKLWPHDLNLKPFGSPVTVHDEGSVVTNLNELEYDPQTGLILANVLGQPKVAFIDPKNGQVKFWLDCAKISQKTAPNNPEAVLNGLALDAAGRLYLTGKLWPKLYQVAWDD